MRPPCASTIPLQMARPRPSPRTSGFPSAPLIRENFLNSCGSSSADTPLPSSMTETATWESCCEAVTMIVEGASEYLEALERRLVRTWTTRCLSAATGGRSGGRSTSTLFSAPPPRKAALAWSTRDAIPEASGAIESVPASIRVTSRRSLIRLRIWSACSSMIRKNWYASAGLKGDMELSALAAEPLMAVNGIRSSWLTVPRNSARSRSSSSNGVMSCRVAMTDKISPCAERTGVALMTVVTACPSGRWMTISSARTVSPVRIARVVGSSSGETSRPSRRRKVITLRSSGRDAERDYFKNANMLAVVLSGLQPGHPGDES